MGTWSSWASLSGALVATSASVIAMVECDLSLLTAAQLLVLEGKCKSARYSLIEAKGTDSGYQVDLAKHEVGSTAGGEVW